MELKTNDSRKNPQYLAEKTLLEGLYDSLRDLTPTQLSFYLNTDNKESRDLKNQIQRLTGSESLRESYRGKALEFIDEIRNVFC